VLPEIDLFGLELQTFGLMLALAFVVCGLLVAARLRELGKPVDWAYEYLFAAILGGLVGARLWWIAEHWETASDDLLGSLLSGTGLTFHGGAIGGALAVIFVAWRKGELNAQLFDLGAAPLAAGYAVGRIGCQLAGDGDYGIAWDGPWAMAYPDGTVPTTQEVHPTPIYETIVMGLVTVWLWRMRDRVRPGSLFALWLLLAGLERFLVEFIRRNDEVLLGLTQPQLVSLVMVAAGAGWLLRARGRPVPARRVARKTARA
jgi:phosphatidylglycerol---prolipoprotein diacylglyceryl transferase